MRGRAQAQKASARKWAWPIDIAAYDRSLYLSIVEKAELDSLIHRFDSGVMTWPRQTRKVLYRLVQPINDALSLTCRSRRGREVIRTWFLREMNRRHSSLWAWTREEWLDIVSGYKKSLTKDKQPRVWRQQVMAVGYLLGIFTDIHSAGRFYQYKLAVAVYGQDLIDASIERVRDELQCWGYGISRIEKYLPNVLCGMLLVNRSPYLEDLTPEVLESIRRSDMAASLRDCVLMVSRALASLKILARPLSPILKPGERFGNPDALDDVPVEWARWCQRWRDTSTTSPKTRDSVYYLLLKAGRWLAKEHPNITSPELWTRELAAKYVAAVDRMVIGELAHIGKFNAKTIGKPLSPGSKNQHLGAMRIFLRDCQEWNWIPRRLDPGRCFATPRSIRALIAPNPRVIADDIWAKLLWAGLNLTAEDLPVQNYQLGCQRRVCWYPLEMMRAMAIVWLFAGLRLDEFRRLRVGCIRSQQSGLDAVGADEEFPEDLVCFLDVPTNKTGRAYTKPVDRYVGEAVIAWERVRPEQPAFFDPKTGEVVHYLFSYRGKRLGKNYLNGTLIPMLCRKAGVPESDARGAITSHRARATITSQLYNAKEPMSLFELQEWLGHRSPESTRYYIKPTPTKLAKSYTDAGYFQRNRRAVGVLIDQDAIKSGAAANGKAWIYYDLGHGICSYEFFEQCPHRMACAKCPFYIPKISSMGQILEGKNNLLRMQQEIPLSDAELAAVEDGIAAYEKLVAQLADKPTPAGLTPNQLVQLRSDEKQEF